MHPVSSMAGIRRFRCVAVGLFSSALGLASAGAMGGTVQLVRDINTTLIPASSSPQSLGTVGGKMLFGATDSMGAGLWSTNGTAAGTQLLQRLNGIGVEGHSPEPNFLPNGTGAYFVTVDGNGTSAVWFTDGSSAGTRQVAAFTSNTSAPASLKTMLGNTLIFSAYDANTVGQMYATDGTAAGTQALTSIAGPNAGVLDGFVLAGNKFYFVAEDTFYAHQIWVSDGTAAGTHMVTNGLGGANSVGSSATYNPISLQLVGNLVLYASSGLLWSIDTATDTIGAVTVGAGPPGFGPPSVQGSGEIANMGGFALFLGNGSVFPAGIELWRSDGTTAGTYKVADVTAAPSFNASQFPVFEKVGNKVVYVADDGQNGSQLWSSDGTAANTIRLTNATQPANSPFQIASPLATIGNIAYFAISDGASTTTSSVWQTDGTAAGTRRVGGLQSVDLGESGITQVAGDAATVFFAVYDATVTATLYKYAPAANTSILLKAGLAIFNGDEFAYGNGQLFFTNNDPMIGDEPWVSDGAAAGTQLIEDIYPQTTDNGSNPDEFVQFGGRLVFAADDGISGRELWISDATSGGTTLLADINPGAAGSNPNGLFTANGALYFFATDATGVSRFMRLASIGANVEVLAALSPQTSSGLDYSCPQGSAAAIGAQIFFTANDGQSGLEVWTSDGTAAGTHLVADISAGISDSYPCYLTALGSHVFFSAVGPAGNELWSTDGSAAGTVQVADINPGPLSSYPTTLTVFNGALYFAADDGVHGTELWKSDGSAAGTVLVADVVPGIDASYPAPLGMLNGKLLFEVFILSSQSTIGYVSQLWTTDGTAGGTSQVATPASSGATPVTNGKQVFYVGEDSSGVEPWVSDGTVAGTHLLKDINPDGGSYPIWFENFNGITLFEISTSSGEQLWRSDGTAAGTIQVSGIPPQYSVLATTPARHRLTVGQKFFFSALDPTVGLELYALTNNAPTAVADTAASMNDAAVTVNVLANDTDPDGSLDAGSIQIGTNAAHGNAAVVSGAVVYTPSSGFSGTDSFTYTVNDNQGAVSAPVTVTITVSAPASAPSKSGGGAVDILTLLGLVTLLALGAGRAEILTRRR
jgi:ELWxxDGT repeat protein